MNILIITFTKATTAPTQVNNAMPTVANWILEYIWVPVVVPLIIFLVYNFYKDLIYVKEIKKATDRDIESFKDLYNSRIKEGMRIEAEEILEFVDRQQNDNVEHHLFICKHNKKVVGFIKFMVSKLRKSIFIAYIAIDKDDKVAKECAVKKMINKVLKKYFNPQNAHLIITEIEQGPKGKYLTAFAKIIARYASDYKHDTYYVDAPYIQPKMPGEENQITQEDFMSLIYIPYYKVGNDVISKKEFIDIIEFIYYDIYGPSCNEVMCDCNKYNTYLGELIKDYKKDCEEYIDLKKIGGSR